MPRHIAVFAAVLLLSSQAQARATCAKDADCKGDRICEDGKCVSPTSGKAQPPPGLFEASPGGASNETPVAPADSGPTLEETFKFIEGKLEGLTVSGSSIINDIGGAGWPPLPSSNKYVYTEAHHQNCVLSFNYRTGDSSKGEPTQWNTSAVSIDLRQVDPGSIRAQVRPPDRNPQIVVNNNYWELEIGFQTGPAQNLTMGDTGQELASRLAKAFARAAQLCGARSAPF